MDQPNGAAHRGFGCHMTHHHAPSGTRESAIGDQAHALTQTCTNQCAGGGQHLGHARAAFGAEVAQDHHIAGFDVAVQDGFECRLLVVKHTGGAGDDRVFQTGDFGDATFG